MNELQDVEGAKWWFGDKLHKPHTQNLRRMEANPEMQYTYILFDVFFWFCRLICKLDLLLRMHVCPSATGLFLYTYGDDRGEYIANIPFVNL